MLIERGEYAYTINPMHSGVLCQEQIFKGTIFTRNWNHRWPQGAREHRWTQIRINSDFYLYACIGNNIKNHKLPIPFLKNSIVFSWLIYLCYSMWKSWFYTKIFWNQTDSRAVVRDTDFTDLICAIKREFKNYIGRKMQAANKLK